MAAKMSEYIYIYIFIQIYVLNVMMMVIVSTVIAAVVVVRTCLTCLFPWQFLCWQEIAFIKRISRFSTSSHQATFRLEEFLEFMEDETIDLASLGTRRAAQESLEDPNSHGPKDSNTMGQSFEDTINFGRKHPLSNYDFGYLGSQAGPKVLIHNYFWCSILLLGTDNLARDMTSRYENLTNKNGWSYRLYRE